MSQLFSILKDVPISVQQSLLQHTFVLFGSERAGKSTIISKVCSKEAVQQSAGLVYEFHKTNIVGYLSHLQFFEVSGEAFRPLVTVPLNRQNYRSATLVIVLDLSQNPTEIVPTLEKELQFARQESEEKLASLISNEEYKELEQQAYDRIQEHHDRNRMRPTLIPTTIVGWKYDDFQKQLDAESRKWISRAIRYLALSSNCALVYGSQQDAATTRNVLFQNIKKGYLYQTDHMKQLAISYQADTIEQIGLPPGGNNPVDGFNKIIKEQIAVNPSKQQNSKKKEIAKDEIQDFKDERIDRLLQQYSFQLAQKPKEVEI